MNTQEKEADCTHNRKVGLEEEQALCNEALKSGNYDLITDAAWIALCEKAVAKSREPSPIPNP